MLYLGTALCTPATSGDVYLAFVLGAVIGVVLGLYI